LKTTPNPSKGGEVKTALRLEKIALQET